MKTLIINPHCDLEKAVGSLKTVYTSMPPSNIAYLATMLRDSGVDVKVHDESVMHAGVKGILDEIENEKPDAVGISCLTQNAPEVFTFCRAIKDKFPKLPLVLGNLHADYFANDVLNENLADFVVHGEGEHTIVDLMHQMGNGKDYSKVAGISFKPNGEIIRTLPRPYINDLDELPFPDWTMFPIEKYRLFPFAEIAKPGTLISGSRGCPYYCNFCSLLTMGHKRRKRTLENMVAEFEYLHDKFGYKQISFIDPIFPISKKEGLTFSKMLIDRGLHKKVVWTTETRVDLVDEELLAAMKESGCRRIMYGFEVGNDDTLDNINKGFELDEAVKAVKATKKVGMEIIGFFMVGVPGETKESAEKTIKFAKMLDVDFAKFNVTVPYPGTTMYEEMVKSGKLTSKEWHRYTSYPSKGTPPVFIPEKMTADEVIDVQRKAFRDFYVRPKMIFRYLFQIRTVSLKEMLIGALSFLKN